MKTLFIFLLTVSVFNSCGLFETSDQIVCPYEVKYGSHNPLIPAIIYPQNLYYNVGDTIHISAKFKDSVYDVSTDKTFLLKKFPFDPGVKLWRFENDSTWENGLLVNDIIMDTLYYQRLDKNDDYVGVLYVDFVEKENKYFFEMDIVIKKKAGIFFSLKIMFTDIRVTIMMKKLNHILSKVNVI